MLSICAKSESEDHFVQLIFEEVLNVKLNDYTDIVNLDVDSLDLINIFFKLESDLGIIISNEEVNEYDLTNSENLLEFLKKKISK